jgi:hypothetical protein
VNKEFCQVSPEEYRIIRAAHGLHIANRQTKITLDIVINLLSSPAYTSTLNYLIKKQKLNCNENK